MPDGFGKYDVYTTTGSIYCYTGTNVLRNRFGIRDGAVLKQIEADITAVRQHALLTQPIPGRFTPHHLCRIHRYLFEIFIPLPITIGRRETHEFIRHLLLLNKYVHGEPI